MRMLEDALHCAFKYNLIAGRKTNCVRLTMDNKINGQETIDHVRCLQVADWLNASVLCQRDVETQLQIVMSTMAIDGVSIVDFPMILTRILFYLFVFFLTAQINLPKPCNNFQGKHRLSLFTLFSFYYGEICVPKQRSVSFNFFRILPKLGRIFYIFNLCILMHGILRQLDISFYCGLVTITSTKIVL